jgi:hypothetical protein
VNEVRVIYFCSNVDRKIPMERRVEPFAVLANWLSSLVENEIESQREKYEETLDQINTKVRGGVTIRP